MKKLTLSSSDWLRIGIETGWMKEAKWSDMFKGYTPAQKEMIAREEAKRKALLEHVRILETYTQRMASLANTLAQVRQVLDNDPMMFTYISNFKDGDKLIAQLQNIESVERAFRTGTQFMQAAMQKTINEQQVLTPETGRNIAPAQDAPAEPAHSVDAPQPGDIEWECPNCQRPLSSSPFNAGLEINCPDCGADIRVPQTPNAEQPAEESSATITPPVEPQAQPAAQPEADPENQAAGVPPVVQPEAAPQPTAEPAAQPQPQQQKYPLFQNKQKAYYWPAKFRGNKASPSAGEVIEVRVNGPSVSDDSGDMGKDKIPVIDVKTKNKYFVERQYLFKKPPPTTHPQ